MEPPPVALLFRAGTGGSATERGGSAHRRHIRNFVMTLLLLRRTLMRTMLVGAVMLLAYLSGAARADEADAVKAVEKLGGTPTRDDKLPGEPVTRVSLGNTRVTDAGLKELKDLKQLASLDLF